MHRWSHGLFKSLPYRLNTVPNNRCSGNICQINQQILVTQIQISILAIKIWSNMSNVYEWRYEEYIAQNTFNLTIQYKQDNMTSLIVLILRFIRSLVHLKKKKESRVLTEEISTLFFSFSFFPIFLHHSNIRFVFFLNSELLWQQSLRITFFF